MKLKKRSKEATVKPSKEVSCDESIKVSAVGYQSSHPPVKESEIISLAKPLFPPGIDEATTKPKQFSQKRRIISPSMTDELYTELLSNNMNSLRSTRKNSLLNRSASASMYKSQEKYEQLLAKIHGYIPPRKK